MISISHFIYPCAVTYTDVGLDGRLCHRGALRLLQEAAAVDSYHCGYSLLNAEETGVCWILTGWRVQLLERPLWNAPLAIETWPRTLEGFLSDRDFRIVSGDTPVALATSRWCLINIHTGRVTRVTDAIRDAYTLDTQAVFAESLRTNGKSGPDARETFSCVIGRRDIDTNHHVNNLHYLDYAMEALPQPVFDRLPDTLEIVYRKQILLGTSVRCLYQRTDEGRHQVEVHSGPEEDPVHHAFLWFY